MSLAKHKKPHKEILLHKEKFFLCKFCDYKSLKKALMDRHLTIHDKHFSCLVCKFTCSTQRKLKNHMLVHSGKNYFECCYCDYTNKQQSLIKTHIARIHPDVKLFKCKFCDFKAVDEHVIEKHTSKLHMQIADDSICVSKQNKENSDCNYEGKTKSNLKYPVVVMNRCEDKNYKKNSQSELPNSHKCIADVLLKEYNFMRDPECNYLENNVVEGNSLNEVGSVYQQVLQLKGGFEMVASIFSEASNGNNASAKISRCEVTFKKSEVLQNNHQEQRVFSKNCNKIDKILKEDFETGELLQMENTKVQRIDDKLRNAKLRPFCNPCSLTFKNQMELIRHNTLKHSNIESFKCTLCDFTTKVHKHLINHIKRRHKSMSLPCGKCTFARKNVQDLKKHLSSHKGKALYNCDACHYSSPSKSVHDIHKFIHSGKTKHLCNQCGFKSATKYGLNRHIKTH